jgi:ribonuclease-3
VNRNRQKLQQQLGYSFSDQALLELALTHRSKGSRNNERLEFLGDSLLNFFITDELYARFGKTREGQLSRLRAQLVRGLTLAELANEMNVGPCLILGSGELKSGGQRRESILADAVEALIGAIYLDGGMEACRGRVLAWFEDRLAGLSPDAPVKDAKTRLQEYLQSRGAALPKYNTTEVSGQAHEQTFVIECRIALLDEPVSGSGRSRRLAEQEAAGRALAMLQQD